MLLSRRPLPDSSNLAAAYGLAVTAAMIITTLIAFFVIWQIWSWPLWHAALLIVPLLFLEQTFLTANLLKVLEGAWVPLMIAACVGLVMITWVRGSRLLAKQTRKNEADLDWLLRRLEAKPPHRVAGTAVFFTADPTGAPTALMHNLKHNRVLHERNIILSIRTEDTPRIPRYERVTVERITDTFIRVVARYGFMETPSVPKIFDQCRRKDLNVDMSATSFFLSRRNLKPTPQVRDAAVAGSVVRGAGALSAGRYHLLPNPDGSRRRGRHPGRHLRQRSDRDLIAALLAGRAAPICRRAGGVSPSNVSR